MRRILPLLVVVGCAQEFADLAPFPCPNDHRCPDNLSCIPGEGCAPVRADAPCPAVGACGDSAGDLVCWQSLCETYCSPRDQPLSTRAVSCPGDRQCVAGVCLLDCTGDSTVCPAPLECKTYDQAGSSRVCMPASVSLPACAGATVGDSCSACGAGDFTVQCPTGDYCASNSSCADNNTCNCNDGYRAVTCNGTPCSSENPCPYPDWHCIPNLASITCDGTTDAYSIDCTCVDSTVLTVPCGGGSCENACIQAW